MFFDIGNNIPDASKSFRFFTFKVNAESIFCIKQKLNRIHRVKPELFEF